MTPFEQFWPKVPHVLDQNKQLTLFPSTGDSQPGIWDGWFISIHIHLSVQRYIRHRITLLIFFDKPKPAAMEEIRARKKCDYDYDYICMLIERFHAFIPCQFPHSSENSKMELSKALPG